MLMEKKSNWFGMWIMCRWNNVGLVTTLSIVGVRMGERRKRNVAAEQWKNKSTWTSRSGKETVGVLYLKLENLKSISLGFKHNVVHSVNV